MKKDHLEMILEDMNGKFDLVLEGQESLRKEMHGIRDDLSDKIDLNGFKIEALNKKVDAVDVKLSKKIDDVAADLREHRADTEVHRKGWRVREE
jgi:hypothetical protein